MNLIEHFKTNPIKALEHIRLAATEGSMFEAQALQHPDVVEAVVNLPKEHLGLGFRSIIEGPSPERGFALLLESSLMQHMLAQAVQGTPYEGKLAPWSMDQNNQHHTLTLEKHTLETLRNSLALHKDALPEKKFIMSLTAICHDLGKMVLWIHGRSETGSVSYHGHENHSAHLAEHLLAYLNLADYIPAVRPLVKHHMRPHFLVKTATSKAIRNLLRNLKEEGACWRDLLNQAEADRRGKTLSFGPSEEAYLVELNALREKMQIHALQYSF